MILYDRRRVGLAEFAIGVVDSPKFLIVEQTNPFVLSLEGVCRFWLDILALGKAEGKILVDRWWEDEWVQHAIKNNGNLLIFKRELPYRRVL